MTPRESAIVGAYTGYLAGPFTALHSYVEELHGRPVFTHEMGDPDFAARTKELAKPDFLKMAEAVPEEESA